MHHTCHDVFSSNNKPKLLPVYPGVLNVFFQKIPILPRQRVFLVWTPHSWKFQFRLIHSFKKFLPLRPPSPLRIPMSLCGGGMDIFWNHTRDAWSQKTNKKPNKLFVQVWLNPLSPNSDKNEISLYIIIACSNTQVLRMKETITQEKMLWYLDKFSLLFPTKCMENSKENMHFNIRASRVKQLHVQIHSRHYYVSNEQLLK